MINKCIVCGCEFDAIRKNQTICSDECRHQRRNEFRKAWRDNHKEEMRKYEREYQKSYAKKKSVPAPTQPKRPNWLKTYVHADDLSKVMMIVRANDMTYTEAQAMRLTKPKTWEKLVADTKARMKNEYC